jgi:hypothetical protein
MTSQDKLILLSAKIHPNEDELSQINELIPRIGDWDSFCNIVIDRGFAPLFYDKLSLLPAASFIPSNIQVKLHQSFYKTLSRSMLLYDAFRVILEAFNRSGVEVIALKGVYLSEFLYENIGLRQFSDIDLLVKPQEGKRCLELLAELGYKPFDSKESDFIKSVRNDIVHFDPMILGDISIEIHIKLHRSDESFHIDPAALWKKAIPVIINKTPVYVLNDEDMLIHLCIHLDIHFRDGRIQFTSFLDITNFLTEKAEQLDWNVLNERCREFNCENEVFLYLVIAHEFMFAPLPVEIYDKYASILKPETKKLFLKYLNGYSGYTSVSEHIYNIKKQRAFSLKLKYLIEIIFPPKAFMIKKYNIVGCGKSVVGSGKLVDGSEELVDGSEESVVASESNKKQTIPEASGLQTQNYKLTFWFLWYPYRWWVGVKGVVKMISRRK